MSALLSSITTYLPQHPGLLPQWLLFVGVVAILNSIQAYTTLSYTSRIYCSRTPNFPTNPPSKIPTNTLATPLSARTFATWTMIQGIVRIYAAYNIDNAAFYQLAFLTYVVAWAHFIGEWFLFGSTSWGAPLAGPVMVSNISLVWMWVQWEFYGGY